MSELHRIQPHTQLNLSAISADGKTYYEGKRMEAEASFKANRKELAEWQNRWYAEGKRKLLIVFQALDAGGKDGTIRRVFSGINPQGVRVASFKAPTKEELDHDYLWRIHKVVPAKGMIAVFNRSHYEDVLVVRVHDIVPEAVWRPRFEQINQFEKLLADTGTTIIKFYLHISKDEQAERFQERLDDPAKHWKFDPEDLEKRAYWDDYLAAFEEAISRCSTTYAPWYVIPANQNWYRNWAISQILVDTMRELNPQYPQSDIDPTQFTIV
ncbi:MAG: polyphosphate kinase 2 family protein [Anaerolineae bacterium]|nr:polyphosphate kinase 2 family protein [Anaerolineae bacterium]